MKENNSKYLLPRTPPAPVGCSLAVGLSNIGPDHPSDSHEQFMEFIPNEVEKAASEEVKLDSGRDVLIVVDVQRDFFSGPMKAHDAARIVQPLNAAIGLAESKGMVVVFTQDWHPPDHWSFKENGGPWLTHCVMKTPGAELVSDIERPPTSAVFKFGVYPDTLGYSPLENTALDLIVSSPQVRTVYVAGIALEYCIQATCLGILERGKRTVALETAIAAATDNLEEIEKVWSSLVKKGVVREKRISALGDAAVT
jgi:nicotinamidase/pyrazinamidase